MDMFKFIMLMLYTMVPNNGPYWKSNNDNSGEPSDKKDVEIELNNLPAIPPGFHFVPSACLLILDYLVKKIIGAPLATDMVKVRDGIQVLDPEQHDFDDEFGHCQDNQAYYITNRAERTTEEEVGGGGSNPATIIKTTSGYWREKKRDIPIHNADDQIIGYKTRYIFCRGKYNETSWRMDEFTATPETIPANARNQVNENVACRIRVKEIKTPDGPYSESEVSNSESEEFQEEVGETED